MCHTLKTSCLQVTIGSQVSIPNSLSHVKASYTLVNLLVRLGLMCCWSWSTEPRLTTGLRPNQKDATEPNWSWRPTRNSCKLPRFTMSCRFPSLKNSRESTQTQRGRCLYAREREVREIIWCDLVLTSLLLGSGQAHQRLSSKTKKASKI